MNRHLQTFACLGLSALIVAVAVPLSAPAQDRSVQERLDRLERDLSMLQRQVYHGYAGGSAATSDNPDAVNVELRMERLEAQMRDLTGRVEDAVNEVRQLHQRIEQINNDVAVHFGELPAAPPPPGVNGGIAGAVPGSAAEPSAAAPPADAGALTPPPPAVPGTAVPAPAPIFHTLQPPGAARAPAQRLAAAPAGGMLPTGSASEQYNYAFGLLKQADYADAESALREFVRRHPGDTLAGNAQYWLGETYYARGKYAEAASAFAEGYKRYPRGSKAPDDLLKLGMSLARAKQRQNACLAFGQLDHDFPNPGSAIKERASAERKRLGC
jgi:tol-pal system protein YbgF